MRSKFRVDRCYKSGGWHPLFALFEVAHAARQLEATMELMVRLNVLAALLSFGLIAAIVVGVV
ncbi:hypothetical protein [Hyphomicrobium sulfonivorans]|uniref:hypothetical protein n=1 Tax=Hyphomicrobium sulfonivorans TaxID=121290 RepID=UPI00156FB686|nr:hypothetical protein [Hyphomicrobium sulfonivorans]MBI1650648.1 hypothetical protein [Hyphomicrobium sulfonivorans]